MKFVCDRCGKRFSSVDEPMPGRVYRIRCRCGNAIQITAPHAVDPAARRKGGMPLRDEATPAGGPAAAARATPAGDGGAPVRPAVATARTPAQVPAPRRADPVRPAAIAPPALSPTPAAAPQKGPELLHPAATPVSVLAPERARQTAPSPGSRTPATPAPLPPGRAAGPARPDALRTERAAARPAVEPPLPSDPFAAAAAHAAKLGAGLETTAPVFQVTRGPAAAAPPAARSAPPLDLFEIPAEAPEPPLSAPLAAAPATRPAVRPAARPATAAVPPPGLTRSAPDAPQAAREEDDETSIELSVSEQYALPPSKGGSRRRPLLAVAAVVVVLAAGGAAAYAWMVRGREAPSRVVAGAGARVAPATAAPPPVVAAAPAAPVSPPLAAAAPDDEARRRADTAEAERRAEAERAMAERAEAERRAEAARRAETDRTGETGRRASKAERRAEAERKAEAARRAVAERKAEAERRADAERKAEAERRAEAERKLEAERRAEAERKLEAERRAEAERKLVAERRAEAERKAEADRRAEAERKAEAERRAEAERKARQEKRVAAARPPKTDSAVAFEGAAEPAKAAPAAVDPALAEALRRKEQAVAPRAEPVSEGLDPAEMQAVLRSNRPALETCVERALADPQTAGYAGRKVALLILVAPNGRAEAALEEPDLDASAFGACLRRAASRMDFPAFRGEAVGARIPLVMGKSN